MVLQPDEPSLGRLIHTLPAREVYSALGTGPEGLSPEEVRRRGGRYGPNRIQEIGRKPLYLDFLSNFTHLMALLLWAGGAIAFVTQTPELGVAIWMVNIINGSFSFWQEYRAEQAVTALRRMLPLSARVIRAGEEQRIPADELVPGDLVLLSEGDRISADARIVRAADLRLDQSALTGESKPVHKTDQPIDNDLHLSPSDIPNIVYAGTSVLAGSGTAVVCATGMTTVFGKIAHLTQSVGDDLNPLQRQLRRLTQRITVISLSVGVIFFVLGHILLKMSLAQSFLLALGMIVAFVPEGLLPTVTLSLALGVQRMARRHALIKRLSSVEALGRTSVICTDKTGTLTKNEMTVTGLWLASRRFQVTGTGYAPDGDIIDAGRVLERPVSGDLWHLLLAVGLCNNTRLVPPHTESPHWTVLGDPTEAAFLVAARKAGLDLGQEARVAPRVHDISFDSHRRRMTTVHRVDGARLAYTKGSPLDVLALCIRYRSAGVDEPLGDDQRARILAALDDYAREGLRVLAVAMRVLPDLPDATARAIECDMTFLGLIALLDPPRPDVKEAVEKCHRAGIRILMMTGDYSRTAEGIARAIGIAVTDCPRSLTSLDLGEMNDAALRAALQQDVIFSRITPEDKLRVVRTLRQMGHIVAVTGDGVNDAPALKEADIGIAMGLSGTDVAKEAADMILTDDHFASIVNAVEEGRAVYDNIRKFTTYVFASNMAEGVPFVVTLFSLGRVPLPITVMQTLAVDLGTDLVPAIGLGAEAPEPGVMESPPRSPVEPLLSTKVVALGLFWYGLIDTAAAMSAYLFLNWEHGWPGVPLASAGDTYAMATTMTLAGIVLAQAGAAFACRSDHGSIFKTGFFTNRLLVGGVAIELLLLLLLMYVPALREVFNTAPISLADGAFVVAWAPLLLLLDELRKALGAVARRRRARVRDALVEARSA
jgi:P-type Ca2+ transporter type 2C